MWMPDEFRKIAANFYQDLFDPADPLIDSVESAVHNFSAEELKRLKAFLSEIISRYSDEQLQNLWAGTTAEIGFSEGFRTVLTMIRDHIERHPESRLPG